MEGSQYSRMFIESVDRGDWFGINLALEEHGSLVEEFEVRRHLFIAYDILLQKGDLHWASKLRLAVIDSCLEDKQNYLKWFNVFDNIYGVRQ